MSLVVLAAVTSMVAATAIWLGSRRQRRARQAREAAAQQRAERAEAIAAAIHDPEVRDAWPMVCDAMAQGCLDPAELAARLRTGTGMQLMEEASIDIDDETPARDRVLLYHAGFDPPRRTCPLAAFLAALDHFARQKTQDPPDAE